MRLFHIKEALHNHSYYVYAILLGRANIMLNRVVERTKKHKNIRRTLSNEK